MKFLNRFINILFTLSLLSILSASSLVYYYQGTPAFAQWVDRDAAWAHTPLNWLIYYAHLYGIEARWGIGLVFALVILYLLIGFFRQRSTSKPIAGFTLFLINMVIVVAGGILASIYYWPDDTINLGMFQLQRGPREQFLDNLFEIGLLVAVVHLFLFLLIQLWRWISWVKPIQVPKSTRDTTRSVSKTYNSGDPSAS